jgi:quercetin dioxygenase-like cupin family protein
MLSAKNQKIRVFAVALVGIAGVALGWGLRTAVADGTPPTADKGLTREKGPEIDLGPELAGYKLRMTVVTFAPSAVRAIHDHKSNPEVGYILEGTLTESRPGSGAHDYSAGSARANGREVEHWLENRGSGPAKQVVVSVVKAQ